MRFRARALPLSSAGELRGSVYPCTPLGLPEDKSTLATIMSGGYDEHTFCHPQAACHRGQTPLNPRQRQQARTPALAGRRCPPRHALHPSRERPPQHAAPALLAEDLPASEPCDRQQRHGARGCQGHGRLARARGGPAAPSARAGRALRPHRQQRHGAKARHEHGQLERVVARLAQLARDDLHERHVQERACSAVHIAQHPYDTEHMPGDWHLTRNGAGDYQGVTQLSTYDTEHPCIVVGTCLQTRREAIRVYCGTDQHGYQRATVMTPFCCQTHTQ